MTQAHRGVGRDGRRGGDSHRFQRVLERRKVNDFVLPGTSGKGIADAGASGAQVMGNRSQSPEPGVGLNGGLSRTLPTGATTRSTLEGVAPMGSPGRASSLGR
jgi:hypothetical protein